MTSSGAGLPDDLPPDEKSKNRLFSDAGRPMLDAFGHRSPKFRHNGFVVEKTKNHNIWVGVHQTSAELVPTLCKFGKK
uniref:Uncharacterized protein n=1 Tax=Romanomermis culicivorax TaxID=13658 RepID=A0A915L6G8_ROMCU